MKFTLVFNGGMLLLRSNLGISGKHFAEPVRGKRVVNIPGRGSLPPTTIRHCGTAPAQWADRPPKRAAKLPSRGGGWSGGGLRTRADDRPASRWITPISLCHVCRAARRNKNEPTATRRHHGTPGPRTWAVCAPAVVKSGSARHTRAGADPGSESRWAGAPTRPFKPAGEAAATTELSRAEPGRAGRAEQAGRTTAYRRTKVGEL